MGRRKSNRYTVAVIPSEGSEKPERTPEDLILKPVQEFKTLPEQIAKSKIKIKNWYVPELREQYKYFDRMKRIDLVFPYARISDKGDKVEQLLIDLPQNESEIEQCVLKAKALKKLGYKYIWLDDDSTLYDALVQLE